MSERPKKLSKETAEAFLSFNNARATFIQIWSGYGHSIDEIYDALMPTRELVQNVVRTHTRNG